MMVSIVDTPAGERLSILHPEEGPENTIFAEIDPGHVLDMVASPSHDKVAIANQRRELLVVDLEMGEALVLDRSDYTPMQGLAWSPDGKWLAFGSSDLTVGVVDAQFLAVSINLTSSRDQRLTGAFQ